MPVNLGMETIIVTTAQQLSEIVRQAVDAALDARKTTSQPDNEPAEAGQAYISKQAAARLIGCCVSTLDNARRAGKIKAHRIGGGRAVRFDRNEVLALLETKPRQRKGRN